MDRANNGPSAALRPPDLVMRPERLGAMWGNRLSFMRRTLRTMFRQRWHISILRNDLDPQGCGELVYEIQPGPDSAHKLYYVVFSTDIPEKEREDRVIADRWDVATALIMDGLTPDRLAQLRGEVPRQEYGRAEPGTLVWSRGNRSSRFFNYVVDTLADGRQPDPAVLADGGYILRSTAYYANAKFGLTPYETLNLDPQKTENEPDQHPLGNSYMAQMVSAFLFREFSVDLAEHIACHRATERGTTAVRLDGKIRRIIGIGNATGMGLVPYVINNPHVIHSWVETREAVLADVKTLLVGPGDPKLEQIQTRIAHCIHYFRQDKVERKGLFASPAELTADLERLGRWLTDQCDLLLEPTPLWHTLTIFAADQVGVETEELLISLLIDLYPERVDEVEDRLDRAKLGRYRPEMPLAELNTLLQKNYGWALNLDLSEPAARHYFWYYSADSEEPLMGVRGQEAGEAMERPLDIPFRIQALATRLNTVPQTETVGWLVLHHPELRHIVERVQMTADLPYGEVHTNLMDKAVVPLYTQRFQLAQYGMERFNPQSIYWVRVTLLQGAPIVADLNATDGTEPDWRGFSLFSP